jgi:hypothetical protein
MIKLSSNQFIFGRPLDSEWAEAKEKVDLKNGVILLISQIEDDKHVRGTNPERGQTNNQNHFWKIVIFLIPAYILFDPPILRWYF